MIHRIRLRNWRTYEDLDLQLHPGTTFVVAPNGVGKTSLVYGLAWAVFGQHSSVNPKDSIRAGSASAEVNVDIDLSDGRRLTISRTVSRRGAPKSSHEIDGSRINEASAIEAMERAFSIELPVASRLSMMLGGGHIAANDTLSLEGHLHHAFGVAHLLDAAETAESVAKEAEKARAALRSTTRQRVEVRAVLEGEIAELEGEIVHLRQRRAELTQVREAAVAQRSLIERHLALAGHLEQYKRQLSHLLVTIENLLRRPVASESKESISSQLRTELETSEHAIAAIDGGAVTARSVITTADQAVSLLGGDQPTCPTCMRPLPPRQRASALSHHRTSLEEAWSEVNRLEEARGTKQAHAQAVSRLLVQFEALQPPSNSSGVDKVPTPRRCGSPVPTGKW